MVISVQILDGVASIDQQHAKLVDIINELYEIALTKNAKATLKSVFDDLTRYTAEHFDHEEKLYADAGYPKLEEHRAQHEALKSKVVSFRVHCLGRDNPAFAAEMLHVLKQWLTSHTLGADKDACRYLNAHGIH